MGRTVLISIFYIFSYLTFSSAGIYALWKRRFKNKILWNITFGIFLLKLIFDFFIYKDVLLTDKAGFILTAFILVFNYFLYILAFRKISIKELPEKQSSAKEENIEENVSSAVEENNTASIEEQPVVNVAVEEIVTPTVKRKPQTMLEKANQYLNTGEVFSFYYKGTSDNDYKIRNIVVTDISNNYSYVYIEGIDIDLDAPRTFRTDRMLSLTHERDNMSEIEIEELKNSYESLKKTKEIIEQINSAVPNKYFDIPEDIDIETVLSNGGFVKKDGKNCQIFDSSFEYLGSKTWNITSLKKRYPYLLTPKKPVFLAPDGCFLFDFYTYSSELIEQLDTYDDENLKKAERILKY